ncbi:hypothetical protein HOD29_02785 [archaeon]|jgi:hypothetical protein|nr:hypothetical protein [archaeon]
MKKPIVTKNEIFEFDPCHSAISLIHHKYGDIDILPLDEIYEIVKKNDNWVAWLIGAKIEWAKYLIEELNIDPRISEEFSLFKAIQGGNFGLAKYLLNSSKGDWTETEGSMFIDVVEGGEEDLARQLIKRGLRNLNDSLSHFCKEFNEKGVEIILTSGLEKNLEDYKSYTKDYFLSHRGLEFLEKQIKKQKTKL